MNRTDRLVAMVTYLQGRRVVRAEELAAHFEVTLRTIYRDMAALGESGVPISGEAGVGYSLVKGYHLPPVMLTAEEAMALFLGGELVQQFGDASMRSPMGTALLKLRSVLPRESQDDVDRLTKTTSIYGRARAGQWPDQETLLPIQQAVISRKVVSLHYRSRGQEATTVREVEPLGVTYHSDAWYLVAWCRLRSDYRSFKLERMERVDVRRERFAARPDFDLKTYLEQQLTEGERVEVELWFARGAMERARRESALGFKREVPEHGGIRVSLSTYSVHWVARWLLSFGGEARALGPAALVEATHTLLREACARQGVKLAVQLAVEKGS